MPAIKIGYRTVKTAIGTALAIGIAQWLGLEFYSSAGILTILCVKVTQKRSLISSWERFAACIIGILFAAVFFNVLGYHPWSIGLLILLFIPVLVALNLKEGIITSSVIILHLYTLEYLSWKAVGNEVALICIGIGMALIVNLYMPSMEHTVKKIQSDLEEQFKSIFLEFRDYLYDHNHLWDGHEITKAAQLIDEGKDLAFRDVENHTVRYENEYYLYFRMREKQLELIERMMPILSSIDQRYMQGYILGNFFNELSEAVHPGNTAVIYLDSIEKLRSKFREMDLPKDREEFETRSKLLHLLNEIERYLQIKKSFKKSDI
ncbi:aromatic acid exporter family protein [Fictibacillus sp. WQ 8-8]|uniref:aromatic acid exporter family protein n=1 Tax=Fictibacillus sp. WQ 8-8 TaxID=2938788 RepID=UPI00210C3D7F|nr:aromatic acid exporter family protein [Fictibacillus sp. WQ 8-8]MCQ6266141.1 aromatic acid exporter family protein [Fictibacillus sp. WQ 8-8]